MLFRLRSFLYNINEIYDYMKQLQAALKNKNKSREDILPLVEKMVLKLKIVYDDITALITRIYPDDKEKQVYSEMYFPEYLELRRKLAQDEHRQKGENV